ncbi:mucin-5AC-like isoform X5 [Schistocerca gregaria]|uniref:mucin-5AC-like isoform X1 n=1 Tax=Schistocerca gregaria TaxID=7010 RepID=UPI00211E7D11|nr:mucin-5AC-like isoform X1 [Schistocerca gregaria]XP_049827418.1 mucin-5AC-like isoform X2 [Schistocerca gregaria]XP_049827419.1 mucin-5AC-like isoform X3 [Schistocerca gregaria]XP_049827420.1 mucin-5AC-like isoform X4 [Schistocerca gregaria]XP_049827421.1 mucin-5AC-like isoform X5 [Schistocerca gregaria]
MSQLVVIFTLLLVSATAAVPDVSQILTSVVVNPYVDWNGTECMGTTPGDRVCNYNCRKVLLCQGEEQAIELITCQDNYGCVRGECVEGESECDVENDPITCTGMGLFPDPYDCTKFHICKAEGNSSVRYCSDGWAYNPLTGVCSEELTGSICSSLPIVCDALADSSTFPGNPSIYYICVSDDGVEIYPSLYRCPHGGIYNPSTYQCSDSSTNSTATSPSSSSSDVSSSPTTTSVTVSGTPSSVPPSTTQPSSSDTPLTPSPTDSSPTTPSPDATSGTPPTTPDSTAGSTSADTPPATSSATGSSQPTASPDTPGTPPTVVPSSTAQPTPPDVPTTPSLTSSLPSTTPPSTGGDCSNPLEIVPDPSDCSSYYECLPTNKWTHIECIYGYYFNREEEKCLYGSCPYTSW